MRDMLQIQEDMDHCLDQRDEELCQLRSQSQSDGAQLAALSLQMQELISSVESRAEMVGKDLEEINGWFDRHRGEINCLKIREKDAQEETECHRPLDFCFILRSFKRKLFLFLIFMEHLLYFLLFLILSSSYR